MAGQLRSRRLRLWTENPQCHWCGIETIWHATSTGRLPPNAATLDHVYSRLNPARHKSDNPTVLACFQCNQDRGRADDQAYRQIQPPVKPVAPLRGRSAQQIELRRWLAMSRRFRGLGPKQSAVFEQIAVNNDTGHPRATVKALELKGLIVGRDEPSYGPTNSPIDRIPMLVRRYEVPIAVHIQWCRWCSESVAEKEA